MAVGAEKTVQSQPSEFEFGVFTHIPGLAESEEDYALCLYDQVYRELLTYILADPRAIEQANYLLWAAHNLERAADRVTNICERVVFTVTGELIELDSDYSGIESI